MILRSLLALAALGMLIPVGLATVETAAPYSAANSCQEVSDFKCCGDIQVVFRNPDLQAGNDGKVHASGQLFAQFQAIGADADKIVFFGFSFSPASAESDESICDQQPWAPAGAYILNYRADIDPDDGFFINLQTTLVPDGEYLAAVHGYDAADNEIARAWTLAVVSNCDAGAQANRCESDDYPTPEHVNNDITMPWPIMLPGDGALDVSKNDAPSDATLTLEFAEPLAELRVYINGKLQHDKTGTAANFTSFPGRVWDDDLLPGYGPSGAGGIVAPECSQQPPQTCGTLGESWYFSGRAIIGDDVVRVEATDLAGNLAKKEIHIASGAGGAVTDTVPNLQITPDKIEVQVDPGQTAVFRFEFVNAGGSTAHPFATGSGPSGWDIVWTPEHQPTPPGAKNVQELNAKVPPGVAAGIYQVNATIEYDVGGGEKKEHNWDLRVLVGGSNVGKASNETGAAGGEKDSPGLGAILPATLVVAVVAMRRRW